MQRILDYYPHFSAYSSHVDPPCVPHAAASTSHTGGALTAVETANIEVKANSVTTSVFFMFNNPRNSMGCLQCYTFLMCSTR